MSYTRENFYSAIYTLTGELNTSTGAHHISQPLVDYGSEHLAEGREEAWLNRYVIPSAGHPYLRAPLQLYWKEALILATLYNLPNMVEKLTASIEEAFSDRTTVTWLDNLSQEDKDLIAKQTAESGSQFSIPQEYLEKYCAELDENTKLKAIISSDPDYSFATSFKEKAATMPKAKPKTKAAAAPETIVKTAPAQVMPSTPAARAGGKETPMKINFDSATQAAATAFIRQARGEEVVAKTEREAPVSQNSDNKASVAPTVTANTDAPQTPPKASAQSLLSPARKLQLRNEFFIKLKELTTVLGSAPNNSQESYPLSYDPDDLKRLQPNGEFSWLNQLLATDTDKVTGKKHLYLAIPLQLYWKEALILATLYQLPALVERLTARLETAFSDSTTLGRLEKLSTEDKAFIAKRTTGGKFSIPQEYLEKRCQELDQDTRLKTAIKLHKDFRFTEAFKQCAAEMQITKMDSVSKDELKQEEVASSPPSAPEATTQNTQTNATVVNDAKTETVVAPEATEISTNTPPPRVSVASKTSSTSAHDDEEKTEMEVADLDAATQKSSTSRKPSASISVSVSVSSSAADDSSKEKEEQEAQEAICNKNIENTKALLDAAVKDYSRLSFFRVIKNITSSLFGTKEIGLASIRDRVNAISNDPSLTTSQQKLVKINAVFDERIDAFVKKHGENKWQEKLITDTENHHAVRLISCLVQSQTYPKDQEPRYKNVVDHISLNILDKHGHALYPDFSREKQNKTVATVKPALRSGT